MRVRFKGDQTFISEAKFTDCDWILSQRQTSCLPLGQERERERENCATIITLCVQNKTEHRPKAFFTRGRDCVLILVPASQSAPS